MGVFRYFGDRLVNLVAGLGTGRDKAAASTYALSIRDDAELASAYRTAWLPRKIVDIPALDACRKWRNWQADADQITKIEAEEKRLGVKAKTLEALTKARLFGGAAIFIGTGDADPSAELKPESVRQLKYLAVMTRRQLAAGEIENDPMSPFFGRPRYYTLSGATAQTQIHPSRLVIFIGADLPDNDLCPGVEQGWGDSVLQAVFDAVQNSDSTIANVASLVFEAKVDVFKVPDLMQNIGEAEYREKLLERFRLAALGKGINGALVMDAAEEHDQKSASFAGLPDVIDRMLQAVSGAADIPVTRLLGQSPGGLNSTGESDLRNYYDRVQSMQELRMTPALAVLDECLIRSALGSRPPEIFYSWESLWQTTSKERADIGKVSADTIKTLRESSLWSDDALSQAATNMLVELNVLPGLEAAMKDSAAAAEEADEEERAAAGVTDARSRADVADARSYDPSQPRAPAGSANGGQWVSGGAGAQWSADVERIKDEILQFIEEDDEFADFGLRVIPDGYEVAAGDVLPNSKHWDDGIDTGEELDGTSTIGVTSRNVDRAIEDLNRAGYVGRQVVLVKGERIRSGEDVGEVIIRSATVVAAWRR